MYAKAVIIASDKGYEVDDNGNIFYKNKKRSLRLYKGYYYFAVRVNFKNKSFMHPIAVHRFIGYKKFGNRIFKKGIHIRHLDSNSLNNNINNICIGTVSDNNLDKPLKVRIKASLIATSFVKVHNHEEIVRLHNEGMSYKEIMKKFNISSKGTVSFIIRKSMASKK